MNFVNEPEVSVYGDFLASISDRLAVKGLRIFYKFQTHVYKYLLQIYLSRVKLLQVTRLAKK